MAEHTPSVAQEYIRGTYALTQDWYKNADTKAQLILTLDGALVTFLTSAVLSDPNELRLVLALFGRDTWLLFILMGVALLASMMSAICALWSRGYSKRQMQIAFDEVHMNPNEASTYRPELMGFFQHVAHLQPGPFSERLKTADVEFELLALSHQLIKLSANVSRKHAWVNRAFACAAVALGLFLAAGATYVRHV